MGWTWEGGGGGDGMGWGWGWGWDGDGNGDGDGDGNGNGKRAKGIGLLKWRLWMDSGRVERKRPKDGDFKYKRDGVVKDGEMSFALYSILSSSRPSLFKPCELR